VALFVPTTRGLHAKEIPTGYSSTGFGEIPQSNLASQTALPYGVMLYSRAMQEYGTAASKTTTRVNLPDLKLIYRLLIP